MVINSPFKQNTMKKSPIIRRLILLGSLIIATTLAVGLYLFFKPHRNVQQQEAFAVLTSAELTDAFSNDPFAANSLYLSSDGNSKVLVITGPIAKLSTNQNGEPVILIKDKQNPVGVMATLLKDQTPKTSQLSLGDEIAIKGAITSGNTYDASLDLYEHANLVQAALIPLPKR